MSALRPSDDGSDRPGAGVGSHVRIRCKADASTSGPAMCSSPIRQRYVPNKMPGAGLEHKYGALSPAWSASDSESAEMKKMILASLLANVAVLVPVCIGLLFDAAWAAEGYGAATAARGILLSVYAAILMVSAALLFKREPMLVAPLLMVQVLYKLTTPFTVGSFTNPVVISNIVIAVLHLATLSLIYRDRQRTPSTNRAS